VGRLVGPSGATIKDLQARSGCRIAVFGRGSIKDRAKVRFLTFNCCVDRMVRTSIRLEAGEMECVIENLKNYCSYCQSGQVCYNTTPL